MTANMVMLGALCKITEVVSRKALEQSIRRSVPAGKDEINLEAFNLGFDEVQAV
jgi:2-oxoglutarate ferredoxin oxidoreductase subunit gamma